MYMGTWIVVVHHNVMVNLAGMVVHHDVIFVGRVVVHHYVMVNMDSGVVQHDVKVNME